MKHTLKTVMLELNHYVGTDIASGLTPITPVHLELNKLKEELHGILDDVNHNSYKWYRDHNGVEGLITEILGDA